MAKITAIRNIISATAEASVVSQEANKLPIVEKEKNLLASTGPNNRYKEVKEFMRSNFVEGIDYALLPKCTKPSILKYGAIKVLRYLELIPQPTILTEKIDVENSLVAFAVSVSLLDKEGKNVCTGIGFADSREGKFGTASAFNVANTVLKLAKKRALVDAITYFI